MSNRRISELNQLYSNEFTPSDLLISVDVDTGTGLPETKKVLIGDFTSYLVGQTTGSISSSISDLSASVAVLSASVNSMEAQTSSYVNQSQLNTKLNNSLTGSYTAYGIPVLDSFGIIYSNFLPDYVFTFNTRAGNVLPVYGDYSSSMIEFSSSTNVPRTNVQSAIDYVRSSSVNKSGDTMTGILTLSSSPIGSLDAATKGYVDQRVSKSGDTMTGTLNTPGIVVNTDLLYAVQGVSAVGIGTATPTQSAKLHVDGRIRVSEIQFYDNTILNSSIASGTISSFNGRGGAVTPLVGDYAGLYVDSFNGRTGIVVPDSSDYSSYYVTTTGTSNISSGGINFLESFSLYTYSQQSPHDSSSIDFVRETPTGSTVKLSLHQNATSSLNTAILDGDFAFVFNTSLSGSILPEYDHGSEGIFIGSYSSGSNGIRISKTEVSLHGGLIVNTKIKTSNYTLTHLDYYIVGYNDTTPFTITLIDAASNIGRVFKIKNKGLAQITVDATGNGQIDGNNTVILNYTDMITIVSDGVTWNLGD